LGDVELDPVALVQAFEAVGLDGREVHEHVLASVLGDKSKTLLVLEPLHGTLSHSSNLETKFNTLPGPKARKKALILTKDPGFGNFFNLNAK